MPHDFIMGHNAPTYDSFLAIIDGKFTKNQTKEYLLKINQHKIDSNLLFAAAAALMERSIHLNAPKDAIDVCGTGGDGLHTLNISTAVSFVVAASGVCVAKHGNRSVSSSSGSADIFFELGIDINQTPQQAEKSLFENNLAFIYAPLYHPALKNLAEIRKELGIKTIFNYLGPLLNPAQTKYQLIGCFDKNIAPEMLEATKMLGKERCYVVSALDGMDEISISSDTMIFKMENKITHQTEIFNPEEYGYKKVLLDNIKGRDAKYNAEKLMNLLKGEKSSYSDIVILNSALALVVAKKTSDFKEAIAIAKAAIESGSAHNILKRLQK